MSEVHVRWTQNVAGRFAGYEETVERTDFIDGLLANNRLVILAEVESDAADEAGYAELAADLAVEVAKPRPFRGRRDVEQAPEVAFGLAPEASVVEDTPAAE